MTLRHYSILAVVATISITILSLAMALVAQAQEPIQGGAVQGNLIQTALGMITSMLIPALWVSFGPVATKAITLVINSWTTKYVPRGIQVPIAGLLGAVMAGITGDAAGVDPNIAAGIGASVGIGGQVLASLHPDTMDASAPPKVAP